MKKIAENSLAQLRPRPSNWKNPNTQAKRIPINLLDRTLGYAQFLDALSSEEIEDIYIVSKKDILNALETLRKGNKGLPESLRRFENILMPEFLKQPKYLDKESIDNGCIIDQPNYKRRKGG